MERARVLVVEDELLVATDLASTLQELGYSATHGPTTADEAVQAARDGAPDLVLMDVHLRAGSDGFEAAERIRKDRDVPIVFLTAYSDPGQVARAGALGSYGYLVKPFDQRELFTTLETALARHRSDVALRRQERWLAATLGGAADAIVTVDADRTVLFMNPAAESLVGRTAKDSVGRKTDEVLTFVDEFSGAPVPSPVLRALALDALQRFPAGLAVRTPEGDIPISDSAAPIHDGGGRTEGAVMVFQDARPLRALHEQVVGTLAHELRTPLSVARAMVQLARKEVTGQRSVALLTRAMERMDECARIISDVFVFAEYQRQGRLPLAPEDVELGALCGRVVADQTLLNPLRSVRLVPPDSLRVCVDPHRVEQAVSNLVANALHHGAGEVVVRLSRAGEGAEIRVENPGEDIPPEVLARFFEPFERGALPAGRHEAQGLGLGLYIAQAIARAHGGSVRAESGNGLVVFTLVLPVEGLPP